MNAENFADIIRNPAQLYQLSYQELKSLVLQYPYCRNLHHLLLLKSHLDQHRDFENVLEKTAMYSIDRRHLYRLLRSLGSEAEVETSVELGADFLELPDLSALSPRRAPLPLELEEDPAEAPMSGNGQPATPPATQQGPAPTVGTGEEAGEEFAGLQEALKTLQRSRHQQGSPGGAPPEQKAVAFRVDDELIAACSSWLLVLETPPAGPPQPQPKPKSAFHSWVRQYQPEHLKPHLDTLLEDSRPAKKKKKKKKKDRIIAFAERSLYMNDEVVSETLAELLVQQERYDRAIQMYERLILIIPEKSSYFASKIEQLKKI